MDSDPLSIYMASIRRHPVLSAEEQDRLAREYVRTQDPKIAGRLAATNLRLVAKIAHEYAQHNRADIEDLIQEGSAGLLIAIERFDPTRNVRLTSYAAWWIRAYILRFIIGERCLVRVGTTQEQRRLFFGLAKEWRRLEAKGIEVTAEMLAEHFDCSPAEVRNMIVRLGAGEVSMETPISGASERSDQRTIGDALEMRDVVHLDEAIHERQFHGILREKLEEFIQTRGLTGNEMAILHGRILADRPAPLREIGRAQSLTRERIRQIEARLLERIRAFLRHELGDAVPAPCAGRQGVAA